MSFVTLLALSVALEAPPTLHTMDLGDRIAVSGPAWAMQRLLEGRPALESERGDPRGLVPVVEAAAEAAKDPSVRADLHLEAARIHAGPLRSRSRAIEHLRAALDHEPGRDDVRAALADLLEDSSPALAAEQHRAVLARMRQALDRWHGETADLGLVPEAELRERMRPGGVWVQVATPVVREARPRTGRVRLSLTSATLAVDDSFDYIRTRLGIVEADELRLPSEFDYSRQAILYLPRRMPDPRSPEFAAAAGREVIEILRRTRGRAFVLFTSYAGLRAVQAMAELALPYPILAQGSAPRSQLLKQFRETPHAVLFATSSFWQGVDVAGEALSCVIVDKLPFTSPGDPITSARIDAIRARGGEPFSEYQVPLAILTLQQGLGRLIRHRADRGVLAVLDPRLRTKGYGRRFIASLPPAPVVHELDVVEAFFPIV